MDETLQDYYSLNGQLLFSGLCPKHEVELLKDFPFEVGDCLVVGYPKSGNKWLATILCGILQNSDLDDFQKNGPRSSRHQLELSWARVGLDTLKAQPRPAVFLTHLYPELLPEDLLKKVKVEYIIRNPKDVMVSYHEFTKICPELSHVELSWGEFYKVFTDEQMAWGNYFDHIKKWLILKGHPNVMFVMYENLLKDPVWSIMDLAMFMDVNIDGCKARKLADLIKFDKMKQSKTLNFFRLHYKQPDGFLRKGEVGDWRGYFTEEQNKDIDKRCGYFTQETGLEFTFL